MATLSLKKLNKIYDNNTHAVKDFDLKVNDQEFLVLVGPSGCGKSTTLRMIAGLEDITSGELMIDGQAMNEVASKDRDIAMVFQSYALYPHMSVYDNMAYGLKAKGLSKQEIDYRIKEVAKLLKIDEYLYRMPKALSGGQKQRVSLGRAIVRNAKVFLMDEPLSSLDAKLRVEMRTEIMQLHKRIKATTIFVTHDQIEAMSMADRIVVMNDGCIQQVGTPKQIFQCPANLFVAGFIGSTNFIRGKYSGGKFVIDTFECVLNNSFQNALKEYEGKEVILGIRPEDIYYQSDIDNGVDITCEIEVVELLGNDYIVHSKIANQAIQAKLSARYDIRECETYLLTMDLGNAHFYDVDTTKRIV